MNFLLVFAGGGLGSLCRYGISRMMRDWELTFPMATFITNVISCLLIGILVGYFLKNGMEQNLRLLFITGFCGGFSTFSTFSYETFELLQNGNYPIAIAYILLSLLVCLLCIFVGLKVFV